MSINISAILVVVKPDEVEVLRRRLERLPGLQIHHTDASTGRFVVTQEAPSIDDEVAGLQRLKAVPGVVLAEMVLHHFAEDAEIDTAPTDAVPEKLKS